MFEVVSRCRFVAGFVRITLAPAITAPDGSLTLPVICPVGAWAQRAQANAANTTILSFIHYPSISGVVYEAITERRPNGMRGQRKPRQVSVGKTCDNENKSDINAPVHCP